MHEMSLMRDLVKKVVEVSNLEGASRVVSVQVWLGALSHMSADHFREHFEEASLGTVAEGAKLKIEISDDIRNPHAQDILFKGLEVEGMSEHGR